MESEHNPSEYVVCFLGGSEKGLELYPFFGFPGIKRENMGASSKWLLPIRACPNVICDHLNRLCVCVCKRKGIRSPETRATSSDMSLIRNDTMLRTEQSPLEEQQVFLATETLLNPSLSLNNKF